MSRANSNVNTNIESKPGVRPVEQQVGPGNNAIDASGGIPTLNGIDRDAIIRGSGGGRFVDDSPAVGPVYRAPSQGPVYRVPSDANAESDAERRLREERANESQRKTKDKTNAENARKQQRSRKKRDSSPLANMWRAAKADPKMLEDAVSSVGEAAGDNEWSLTFNPVRQTLNTYIHDDGPNNRRRLHDSHVVGEDDYYNFPQEEQVTRAALLADIDDMEPDTFEATSSYRLPTHAIDALKRMREDTDKQPEQPVWRRPKRLNEFWMPDTERLSHASDVGKRQREAMSLQRDVGDRMERLLGKKRYRTLDEIRDAVTGTYASTSAKDNPSIFRFNDDSVFFGTYDEGMSDKKIRKAIRREASKVNKDINKELRSRDKNPDTSIDRQRHGGVDWDYESSVSDNVMNARRAVNSTANLIANPFLIHWGSEWIERTDLKNGKVMGKFRFSNVQGRDVEGAMGAVRKMYGCSMTSVMSMVVERLGLGIDTHGKICGVKAKDFVLPDAVIIEACNDILTSAKQNGGMPIAIVQGKPYGVSNSRDDTGMFPVLGGTRCMPLGHIPLHVFEDISRDPASPLHGLSPRAFYTKSIEMFINDVQPHMLANATGPLAWQAVSWNLAMEAALSIDGIPNEMYNIPEHQVNRTRAVMQAQLAEAGDGDARAAIEKKMELRSEVMDRWYHMNFKDDGSRENSASDVPGELRGPGTNPRHNAVGSFFRTLTSMSASARMLLMGVIVTSPLEGLVSTAQQQAVVTWQNAVKRHWTESAYHFGNRFDSTEYLRDAITGDDALEALEVYMTLMRVGGRTALDAFRFDRNDGGTGPRYKATKKDMRDFLDRWSVKQGGRVQELLQNATSFMMFGDNMFRKTKARQFLDMALTEMMQNQIHGGEALDAGMLEEIARSGESGLGSGEALVSALLDTQGGYEAFKTMDYTSLAKNSPWGRAVDIVLKKNGVTEFGFREMFCMFLKYRVNSISRAIPMTNTISYFIASGTKKFFDVENAAMQDEDVTNAFARGFNDVAEMVNRISDYQVGMDSADFWVGMRKNMMYDIAMFGGNYIFMAALCRGISAMLGGMEPPEDPDKITLPWEWRMRKLGVPIKYAWFMDDLMGCGLPLAYAWEIAEGGYDIKGDDGIVRRVNPYSGEAIDLAWHAFKNTVCSFGAGSYVVDAIDCVNNFQQNIDELFGSDPWIESGLKEMRDYYGDDVSKMTDAQLRQEWLETRMECLFWDMFDEFTPRIASQVLPGSRDSMWADKYEHAANLMYDTEGRTLEEAKEGQYTKLVSYKDWQRRLRTRDNVMMAFLMDMFDARDGLGYQYSDMPLRTATDVRYHGSESYEERYGLGLEYGNDNSRLDLDGDGNVDTREERQKYLFDKAEQLCDDIDEKYIATNRYPEYAIADGFIIPYDARKNAENYCYYMLGTKDRKGELQRRLEERKKEVGGRVSDEEYDAYLAEREKYNTILYDYLKNKSIPWRVPRYAKLATDTENMYLDFNGNPSDRLEAVMGHAKEVPYSYGGKTGPLTAMVMPVDQGNYDFQPDLWDTLLDDNGNPINDMAAKYDQAKDMGTVESGVGEGRSVLDVVTAGGAIERGERLVPFDERGWEALESTYPDYMDDLTQDVMESMFGIDSYMPGEETNPDKDGEDESSDGSANNNNNNNNNNKGNSNNGSGRSYYRNRSGGGYYRSYGGGGGSYSTYSNYNPKIYSSSHSVYSTRAAGMSTRQPYRATTSYLRPSFYTSGSRRAYNRLS